MSVRKGNKIVSGRGKNGTGFALFTPKFFDYILNNPSWLRADTFSWHSGELYKSAYEHLVSDLTKSVKLYAWETSDGDVFYTKTPSPAVDDEFYYSTGGYAKAYITAVDTSSGTLTWEDERSRTGTATRKADLDTSYNINISSSTETVGSTEITFYRSTDGHKIVLADQESKVSDIYNATGVAWYYILDTTNKLFKLPRTKYSFTGLRDFVGNFVEAGLPNITGEQAGLAWGTSSGVGRAGTGVFSKTTSAGGAGANTGDAYNSAKVVFDASSSNDTYGKSDTVQPKSTQMYLYFYVGNTVVNQDVLGNNVDYVIERYDDEQGNWYEVWKSGRVRQGGYYSVSGEQFAQQTVNLYKVMKNTFYKVMLTAYFPGKGDSTVSVRVDNTNLFTDKIVVRKNWLSENGGFYWEVEGIGA